jgi:hypothetical protein
MRPSLTPSTTRFAASGPPSWHEPACRPGYYGRVGRPGRRLCPGTQCPATLEVVIVPRTQDDDRDAQGFRADVVAVVTGGSSRTGREFARALASWGWAIVVVYLEHQRTVEATVAEILATDGKIVAVRADLADDLDVQRLFAESNAAFGGVDAVVHTTPDTALLLYEYAARNIRRGGVIVSVSAADRVTPGVAHRSCDDGIVDRAPPEEVLLSLDKWRRQAIA